MARTRSPRPGLRGLCRRTSRVASIEHGGRADARLLGCRDLVAENRAGPFCRSQEASSRFENRDVAALLGPIGGFPAHLANRATPLLASYHEKLLVIDSAIDDLRAQAGMNPSNAHLRRQLLAMYQEKQRTLEEVLEARKQ